MKNPKLYVIIVTYNGMKWIDRCLKSVLDSSINLSIVVVDNNSTDQTVDFITNHYQQVEVVASVKNHGFGQANNIGIEIAYRKGADFFFLLNQDAYVQERTIEDLVKSSCLNSDFSMISPVHYNGNGDALDLKFSNYIIPSRCKNLYSDLFTDSLKDEIYEANFVNAAAWLITKSCILSVGGFNTSFFHYGEDDNYVQRLKYHNLKIGVYPNSFIYHDRENRTTNSFYEDKLLIYQRDIIGKSSNPLVEFTFNKEFYKIYKNLIKSILRFSLNKIKINYLKIRVLSKINKSEILHNKQLSKLNKNPFLNLS